VASVALGDELVDDDGVDEGSPVLGVVGAGLGVDADAVGAEGRAADVELLADVGAASAVGEEAVKKTTGRLGSVARRRVCATSPPVGSTGPRLTSTSAPTRP